MSLKQELTESIVNAVKLAVQVPGSRSAIFTTDPRGAAFELETVTKEAGLKPFTMNRLSGEWLFGNGSVIEVAKLSGKHDEYRLAGVEFQLIILDGQSQHSDMRHQYLSSRLRSHGAVKDHMAEHGYGLECIIIGAPKADA